MKKLFSILCLLMVVACFTSCGNGTPKTTEIHTDSTVMVVPVSDTTVVTDSTVTKTPIVVVPTK